MQDIKVEELLDLLQKKKVRLVDVRSPSEFEDSTIPGSVNIPLFDDEERSQVGTLYKQVGVQTAKEKGVEIVSAKLPAFIREFEEIEGRKAVFCWRGGMRSKTAATLVSLMGAPIYRLEGGMRAYRQWVVETLKSYSMTSVCYVLNGHTGTGKTIILRRLAEEGYPVIDLEGLAGHRGSIFGQIGLKPNNQKAFESLLLQRLIEFRDSPYVLLEAESKRVGKVVLPDFIVEGKQEGTQLLIELPLKERVRHILEDYKPEEHQGECLQAFQLIKRRIRTDIAKEIEEHLLTARFEEAVGLLLEHYYDPRYTHATGKYADRIIYIRVGTIEEAVEAVKRYLPEGPPKKN